MRRAWRCSGASDRRTDGHAPPSPRAQSLFWRTFALLAVLLAGTVLAWQQTFKALEEEPRALEAAQQLAGLVNLVRWRWSAVTRSTASR